MIILNLSTALDTGIVAYIGYNYPHVKFCFEFFRFFFLKSSVAQLEAEIVTGRGGILKKMINPVQLKNVKLKSL